MATALVLAALAPAQAKKKNEAEELFRKMEDKVLKAKTIEYESERDLLGTFKMTLAEGNKARLEMSSEFFGRVTSEKEISDGKQRQRIAHDGKALKPEKILFTRDLPKTRSGKIRRVELRKLEEERASR